MRKSLVLLLLFIWTLLLASPVIGQEGTTCPGALPSRLVPGSSGRVTPGDPNNIRSEPSTSAQKLGEIAAGTEFDVLQGPVCAGGQAWWKVRYGGGQEGWTVESWNGQYALEPYPTGVIIEGQDIAHEKLTFAFDPSLGSGVSVAESTADVPTEAGAADFTIIPAFTNFTMLDYPVSFRSVQQSLIMLLPADEYARINGTAASVIDEMSELLLDAGSLPPTAMSHEAVPALPLVNAGMIFQSHRQMLEFQNGTGIRFITAYGQDIYPITADFPYIYSFQGLSANGQFWISAFFLVQFDLPTDLPPASTFDWEHPEVYFNEALPILQTLTPDDFTPSLDDLDAMIESMLVKGGGDPLDGSTPVTSVDEPASTEEVGPVETFDCFVNASGATIRSGPGRDYDSLGKLESGVLVPVDGQTTGEDGYDWWRLSSGGWVRADVVFADGSECGLVPVVTP